MDLCQRNIICRGMRSSSISLRFAALVTSGDTVYAAQLTSGGLQHRIWKLDSLSRLRLEYLGVVSCQI